MMICHVWTMMTFEGVNFLLTKKYGESTAILAGNSLLTLAFWNFEW